MIKKFMRLLSLFTVVTLLLTGLSVSSSAAQTDNDVESVIIIPIVECSTDKICLKIGEKGTLEYTFKGVYVQLKYSDGSTQNKTYALTDPDNASLKPVIVYTTEGQGDSHPEVIRLNNNEYTAINPGSCYIAFETKVSSAELTNIKKSYPNAKIYYYLFGSSLSKSIDVEVYSTVYRVYNPNSGEHFYTTDENEKNSLASIGWNYEGIGWYGAGSEEYPVYRLYNPNAGDHHYTVSMDEVEYLRSVGWRFEGIAFYSAPAESGIPIYRQYNPNAVAGAHNFTADKTENDFLGKVGWRLEGVSWYSAA